MIKINDPVTFNKEIETMVKTMKMSYLDALLHYSDVNNLESETLATMISSKTKAKLRVEAEQLNFLPKTAKLPI